MEKLAKGRDAHMNRTLKTVLALALALAMCLSMATAAFADRTWIDEDGVIWLIDNYGNMMPIGSVDRNANGYNNGYYNGNGYYYNGYYYGNNYYNGNGYYYGNGEYYLTVRGSGTYTVGDRFTLSVNTNINSSNIEWSFDSYYLRHLGSGTFEVIDAPNSSRSLTITAFSPNYGLSDYTTVTLRSGSSASVTLDSTRMSLRTGESSSLRATVSGSYYDNYYNNYYGSYYDNYNFYWYSEDTSVARVNSSNSRSVTVSAVGPGTTRVRVEVSANGYVATAYCTVTVSGNNVTARLDSGSMNLKTGDTASLRATGSGGNSNYNYYWYSEDTSVARVNNTNSRSATVTAVGPGTTRIRVEISSYGYSDTAYCTINVSSGTVSGIRLTSSSLTMNTNSSVNLGVNVTHNNASYTVSWSSGNTNLVTVSGSGDTVTLNSGSGTGTALVTVTVRDNSNQQIRTDFCSVTVQNGGQATPPQQTAAQQTAQPPVQQNSHLSTPYPGQVNLSTQNLTVDGRIFFAEGYNINGHNYYKLRDVAMMLNGTSSQFSVGYDYSTNAVTVTTGQPYTPAGGELIFDWDKSATCAIASNPMYINGSPVTPWAYSLGGYTFLQLQEMGYLLGFNVDYDEASRTIIVTSK